ncbi:MAG: hypothetical protein V7K27_27305 [Nostoc sp.]|uniref:hypothetical protein n=1 Tax=Nostoc sp. TaxID=1180 RepID=UPI002FFB2B08
MANGGAIACCPERLKFPTFKISRKSRLHPTLILRRNTLYRTKISEAGDMELRSLYAFIYCDGTAIAA